MAGIKNHYPEYFTRVSVSIVNGASRLPSLKNRKKNRNANYWLRGLTQGLKIIFSPLILLGDSFRRKGKIDDSWIFAFFLFFTFVMGLSLIGFLMTESPLENTISMLSDVTQSKEILAGDMEPIIDAINKNALKYKIDPNLIFAIIKSESNFRSDAVSKAGAKGLMQIMPAVWRDQSESECSGDHSGRKPCSKDCIFDPVTNIEVGVKYFHSLLVKYHGRVDLALEAYNAGLTNVDPEKEPKYEETKGYIKKTVRYWQELRKNTLEIQLQSSLNYRYYIKWMFGIVFGLWILFFWWANQKLFSK